MTVVFREDQSLAFVPPVERREQFQNSADRGFSEVIQAVPLLADFRLLADTRQIDASVALHRLMCLLRYDTHDGARVGEAAEVYMNSPSRDTWHTLQLAFADWANHRLVRVIDAYTDPEWLPETDVLDRWSGAAA